MLERAVLLPVGARVTGLKLADFDAAAAAHFQLMLATHGFAVLPEQDVDDPTFIAFLSLFGQLTSTTGEPPLAGFPELNAVSNVGRKAKPRSVFHIDTSYVRRPPTYTALRAVEIPAKGGETLFTNQYSAFQTLPAEVRTRLEGRTIRHVVTGVDLGEDDEKVADHPVFRRHPISGRTSLYVSTPERCVAISGLPDAESRELIRRLYEHSTADDNVYRHAWSAGDVVMWDNGCVMHRADHAGVVGARVLHRGMVSERTGAGHR